MKKLFIVLCLVTLALSSKIQDPGNLLKDIVAKLTLQIPAMKNSLDASSKLQPDNIRRIVGRGFTMFKQNAEIGLYNQVDAAGLFGFLNFLKDNVRLPAVYEKSFVNALSMVGYSDVNQIISTNIVFNVGNGGACKFICVMGQRNSDGTTNWLAADIQTQFELAPNIIVLQQKKSSFFGLFKSTSYKIIEEKRTLTPQQMDVLFTFFEITAFERFAEVLNISRHLQ